MSGFALILIIFLLGAAARSTSLALAAGLLLLLRLLQINSLISLLEARGVEVGLLFLMLTVLIPIALDRVGTEELLITFSTLPGLLAIAAGVAATRLNGMGLNLLESQPQIIFGLVVGSIMGIVFFKGVPVGPLMAGGMAALFFYLAGLFAR